MAEAISDKPLDWDTTAIADIWYEHLNEVFLQDFIQFVDPKNPTKKEYKK